MDHKNEILRLLREDGRLSNEEIAERIGVSGKTVENTIKKLEKCGILVGFRALFDDSVLPENAVKAIIEVKIKPERNGGFDRIAKRISKFSKVESLYLMPSGLFDLMIEVRGETLNDVAEFVSSKLAPMEGVVSTSTHFILKKYKESGKLFENEEEHERLKVTP